MGVKEKPLNGHLKIINIPVGPHVLALLLHAHTHKNPKCNKIKRIIKAHLCTNITKLNHHSH